MGQGEISGAKVICALELSTTNVILGFLLQPIELPGLDKARYNRDKYYIPTLMTSSDLEIRHDKV